MQGMIEKMLSKESATVLKLFFRGLARYSSLTMASTTSIEVEAEAMYEDHPDVSPGCHGTSTIHRGRTYMRGTACRLLIVAA